MMISPNEGIRVGPPLIDFQGILTGVPTFIGEGGSKTGPLMKPHGGTGGQGVP
jgi:hypothetical protein